MLKRFIRYVSINTTSDSSDNDTPSSEGQVVFAKMLVKELKEIGLDDVYYDKKNGYVYGVLKGREGFKKIGFISHMDVTNDSCGVNIKPNVIYNYDGEDIYLNDKVIISKDVYPDLENHIGKTIITSDGFTLLGADNKAGICEIMCMLEYFSNNDYEHGDIYVCFNPDEEIGLGTKNFNKKYFSPDYAFCVDGNALGDFSYENFNGATANININGIVTHYGYAKDIMINACKVGTLINNMLPLETPENTEGYEGFFHLKEFNGDISKASMKYLISDFDRKNFEKRKETLKNIVSKLNEKYNNSIEIKIDDMYYNMKEKIEEDDYLINKTLDIIKSTGIKPKIVPNRGCTDGPNITSFGILCPTLGTGTHNYHSLYEYVCLEDMKKVCEILIEIVKQL